MFLAFLRNMPVNLFAVAMAFCGLTSAWRSVANYYDFHLQWISETFAVVALVLFVVISTLYGLKCFHAFSAVRKEWQDPISVNFFATLPLTLLLIPTVLYRYLPEISFWMWCLGAVLMFLFAWYMISRWLRVRQHPTHVTPGWILPVVGTVNIPAFAHLSHIPIREEIGICIGDRSFLRHSLDYADYVPIDHPRSDRRKTSPYFDGPIGTICRRLQWLYQYLRFGYFCTCALLSRSFSLRYIDAADRSLLDSLRVQNVLVGRQFSLGCLRRCHDYVFL